MIGSCGKYCKGNWRRGWNGCVYTDWLGRMSLIHKQKSRKQEEVVHVKGWGHTLGSRIRKSPREETACPTDGPCGNKKQPKENKQRPFSYGSQHITMLWHVLKGYQLLINPNPFDLIIEGLLFGSPDPLLDIVVCLLQVWLIYSILAS